MTAGRRVPGAGPRSQDQTNAGGRSRPDDMETHLALPRVADIECGSDIDKIIDNARTASDFLKAIAHESRLLILCILAEGEKSVTELETLAKVVMSVASGRGVLHNAAKTLNFLKSIFAVS